MYRKKVDELAQMIELTIEKHNKVNIVMSHRNTGQVPLEV